ncbi:MAG: phosphoribosylglycinamide formyltransferase [Lawsonella sp.]|nr:phosphoribosylglycinamide formyltransferase [Mycobacteriales bacterium]
MDSSDEAAPLRVVVLVSGIGSLMGAIIDATHQPDYPAEVVAVGADRPCEALGKAEAEGIPTFLCDFAQYSNRAEWDEALTEAVNHYSPDLVVSAGFMRITGPRMVHQFKGRFINTHPALLPSFMGAHAVEEALAYGVKYTGSSIHLIDEGMDTGPLLAQEPVPVMPDDTVETLHDRIKVVERRLLCDLIADIAENGTDARVTRKTEKKRD